MIYINDDEEQVEYRNLDSFDNYKDFEEHFESLFENVDLKPFYYYCKHFDVPTIMDSDSKKELIDKFEDTYQGRWDCEEDYCEEMVRSCYGSIEPEFLENYIDYSLMANDWFDNDYIFEDGYVFLNC